MQPTKYKNHAFKIIHKAPKKLTEDAWEKIFAKGRGGREKEEKEEEVFGK